MRVWLNALGTVTPRVLVSVHTRVDGTLLRMNFLEGQMVEAGELLAEIDPRPFQLALDQARGQLARDKALLDDALVDLARYKDLLARDAIPGQQLDTQRSLMRQYRGTVESDRAQIDTARLQLEWTRVTAPISGRIGLRQIDPGNQVHASDATGLVSIAQLHPITVLFAVPEANLPAINRRVAAREAIPVEAWNSEQNNRLAVGQFLTTDNQIDPTTGTIKIRAEFANADNALFPNQFVNVRLLLDTLSRVVTIPAAAIQRGDTGSFVYRLDAGRTVAVVPVGPGAEDGDWVMVTGEIKTGDKVVTDGVDKLRDGAKVEIIVAGATGPKAGTAGGQGVGGGKPAAVSQQAPGGASE